MQKIQLRDFHGRIIGTIETDSNGKKTLRDFYGKILGFYDAKRDVTTNFMGQVVAKGDCLTMLLNK